MTPTKSEYNLKNFYFGDRYENQSDEQNELMAKNIKYTFSVDTSIYNSDECAEMIINKIYN
ncbi:MAG: hypothetical protein J6M16_10925 [Clostridia bacterium]|nr:hypothetical protein [Clostridia bacterium]